MSDSDNWHECNKRYLAIKIKEIQQRLKSYVENGRNKNSNKDNYYNTKNNNDNKQNNKIQIKDTLFNNKFSASENKKEVQNIDFKNLLKGDINDTKNMYNFVPAIEILSRAFKLSEFEKNMVLLCAAVELDSETSILCSKIYLHGNIENNPTEPRYATFALGFTIFDTVSHWSALIPTSPLRRFQILKFINSPHQFNNPLVSLPVTINEQVLHFLLGLAYSETDISGIIQNPPSKLISLEIEKITKDKSLHYYDDNISKILKLCIGKKNKATKRSSNNNNNNPTIEQNSIPVIILLGGDEIDGLLLAQEVCSKLGLHLKYLNAENIPTGNEDLQQLAQNWTRDAILLGIGLFISHNFSGDIHNQILQSLKIFVENIPAPVFIHTSQIIDLSRTSSIINLKKPSKIEQIHIWKMFLESLFKKCKIHSDGEKNEIIKTLINQFDFTSSEIFQVCKKLFEGELLDKNKQSLYESLWASGLEVSKPRIGNLGILIPSSSSITYSSSSISASSNRLSLDDIVLPTREKELLKTILSHAHHRDKVYREWGFAEKSRNQGLGITVLFAGESGTGKTMAAEILSSELKLTMLKVDLSQVVSKYIGETEKNLDKVFESANKGGAVLFFDEADALFGKRMDIKESHDRYANIEISFLLQRMESYNGIAILSTNMPKALDNAFLRRIKFKVKFEVPNKESRLEIWKKTFPKNTPLRSIDFDTLAELKITGGNIRNICLNAAFFAAHDDLSVDMTHIKKAVQEEYSKLGQSLTSTDLII